MFVNFYIRKKITEENSWIVIFTNYLNERLCRGHNYTNDEPGRLLNLSFISISLSFLELVWIDRRIPCRVEGSGIVNIRTRWSICLDGRRTMDERCTSNVCFFVIFVFNLEAKKSHKFELPQFSIFNCQWWR